jgi:hypothetical protein
MEGLVVVSVWASGSVPVARTLNATVPSNPGARRHLPQPEPHFGRILAAYGGVFVAGSLAWGMIADGFRPDRWDLIGAAIALTGVAVLMYAPRSGA